MTVEVCIHTADAWPADNEGTPCSPPNYEQWKRSVTPLSFYDDDNVLLVNTFFLGLLIFTFLVNHIFQETKYYSSLFHHLIYFDLIKIVYFYVMWYLESFVAYHHESIIKWNCHQCRYRNLFDYDFKERISICAYKIL